MAKLKAPLLSLGASGSIGGAIVYFGWKGLDVAREYVIPSNPKSADQQTQRGWLTEAVAGVHTAMAAAVDPINSTDKSAWSALASALGLTMTWFNSIVKMWVDQRVAGSNPCIFSGATITEASGQITFQAAVTASVGGDPVLGNIKYGTSKTALISTLACTVAELAAGKVIPTLTNGTQYFFQYRPSSAGYVNSNSGIYHGTPSA